MATKKKEEVTPAATVAEKESTIETIADAKKAGYVLPAESEKAQKEGKAVVDIITVENRKMHKLQ